MRRSVRVTVSIVIIAGILYTLAGFLLVPWLLKRQIIDVLSKRTGGEVSLVQLGVNPFLFNAELEQLSINTPDHKPFFTLAGAQARVDIASLWRRGWIIPELILDTPRLWTTALPAAPAGSRSTPVFSIGHLQIKRGQLQWSDSVTDAAVPRAIVDLTDIEFAVKNLESDPLKPGQFTFAAVVNRSGRVKSTGSLNPFPVSLDAVVEFDGLNLAELDSLMPAGGDSGQYLKILSARLSGNLKVLFDHGRISVRGQAGLDQLELVDRSNHAAVFSAAKVLATELTIQSSPFRASAELIQLDRPYLRLTRDTDGVLREGHWLRPLFDGPAGNRPSTPRIEFQQGSLDLTDQGLATPYLIKTDRLAGSISRQDSSTTVTIEGRVMGGGTSVLNVHWIPTDSYGQSSLETSIGNLDASVLSPYLAALTGRGIVAGQMDLRFDYRPAGQQFVLKNEISVLGFQLDEPITSTLVDELPLDMAVALLRDGNDRINISIPVPRGRLDGNMQPGNLVGKGFVNLVQSISNAPFRTLGKLVGASTPRLERVVFMPGGAALPNASARKLAILAAALEQRPGLGLKVNGRFDASADRQALARKQVGLHVALATSAGPPGRNAGSAIDFDDSKVISVLDEFAGERLSAAELAALQANHPQRGSAYYSAVFDALVNNEDVSPTALRSLARYRAQTIIDQLTTEGVDRARLQVGNEAGTARSHARVVFVELDIVLL